LRGARGGAHEVRPIGVNRADQRRGRVARPVLTPLAMRHHRPPEDIARMLMTRAPTTAAADDNLIDAAARMADRNVRHLPVVDGEHHVIGMLSDRDVRTQVGDSSRTLRPEEALVRMRSPNGSSAGMSE